MSNVRVTNPENKFSLFDQIVDSFLKEIIAKTKLVLLFHISFHYDDILYCLIRAAPNFLYI